MAEKSSIEWTDATWNPITGCSVHSAGCRGCYAMLLAGTRLQGHPSRAGLTMPSKTGPVWTGEIRFNPQWLDQPLRWARPRSIFVCAHSDLFHPGVADELIDRVFAVMALAPQHEFQVLTKRSDRMRRYLTAPRRRDAIAREVAVLLNARPGDRRARQVADDRGYGLTIPAQYWPLPNIVGMVSAEDQKAADERISDLVATPFAMRDLSLEPLLGPIDLSAWLWRLGRVARAPAGLIRQVIVGGESGPRARPPHPDWVRDLRDQCKPAGVAFHFKQWGEWAPLRADLIPVPRERQGWVHRESGFVIRPKVEADLDAIECEEREAGAPLYGHVVNVGKKAAGRQLDGEVHDGIRA